MRLKPGLPPTVFQFPRGYGEASIPVTGDVNRPQAAIWWTKEQVLAAPPLAYARGKIFLGRVDDKPIGYLDDRHVVTVAGSRGGKSACLLIPNLKLYPGSALVIDPKGELARETAAFRRDALGQDVHVLDPWGVTDLAPELLSSFDPFAELQGDEDGLIDNADLIADALIVASPKDPHWTDAARALLRALVLYLAIDPASSGGSLACLPALIAQIAAEQDESGGDTVLHQLAAFPEGARHSEARAVIRNQAAVMLGANDKEMASIISTARTQLVFLESPALRRNLDLSLLRLAQLKSRPTTIYLCLPASRMATHGRWLRLIVGLAVSALENAAFPPCEEWQLPSPVLFILEEFAALGHMRALEQAIAYMAGFGVKLWVVLQDLTQLKRHYKDGWETFLGNAGVIQAFSVSDLTSCEYLSKRIGETTFQITNKVDVGSAQALQGDTGLRREFKTAPLIAADELARKFARKPNGTGGTAGGLTLVLVAGAHPFVVDRVFHGELVE
ncbi:MAG TPA: type IV secretory system conjugative DNA transfer family protein [Allosphingosinicella sp.]|nr:type IV secretory system conjugative DNA transfer family protein [Allosphingosinicella sp.]